MDAVGLLANLDQFQPRQPDTDLHGGAAATK